MKKAAAFFWLLLLSNCIFASVLKISPTRIDLSVQAPIAIFNITNVDQQDVLVQSELLRWTQQNGKDNFSPTKNILIIPPMFKLKPNQSQLVRFALRNKPELENETSYRVFFTDIEKQPLYFQSGGQAIQMKMRISVPIFVAPTNNIKNTPQWTYKLINNKTLLLSLYNAGNVHLFIDRIQLFAGSQAISQPLKTFSYVLPQQKASWKIVINAVPRSPDMTLLLDDNGTKIKTNAALSL